MVRIFIQRENLKKKNLIFVKMPIVNGYTRHFHKDI
jgi:hypothetical protein